MDVFGGSVPLEYLMYAALGFLSAWLMAFMVMPHVHRRAQRLMQRHYDDVPQSIKEMQAEKDQIRAGFAAATRNLELSIGQLRDKAAAHATDLTKKVQLIERLKSEIESLSKNLEESQSREQSARDLLRDTRRELAVKDTALDAAEHQIALIKGEIARIARIETGLSSLASRSANVVPLAASGESGDLARAASEIAGAARSLDARHDNGDNGAPLTNQRLRAVYAPLFKPKRQS
jgi:DNA repair exonuclease SbcCD ATPase subunit